jgi:hypothetical protein
MSGRQETGGGDGGHGELEPTAKEPQRGSELVVASRTIARRPGATREKSRRKLEIRPEDATC